MSMKFLYYCAIAFNILCIEVQNLLPISLQKEGDLATEKTTVNNNNMSEGMGWRAGSSISRHIFRIDCSNYCVVVFLCRELQHLSEYCRCCVGHLVIPRCNGSNLDRLGHQAGGATK
jgi:hypothetical protein